MLIDDAYDLLFTISTLTLFILAFFGLIKSIRGPRIADRIIAINMIGTIVILICAIFAFKFDEVYLLDISLIYAMLSFLAVILLTKIYIGVHRESRHNKGDGSGA